VKNGFCTRPTRLAQLCMGQPGSHCPFGRCTPSAGPTARESLSVLTTSVVKSSAIEGEVLNSDQVRSSIARRLGLDVAGLPKANRDVEGIVELMLDATENFTAKLTEERLFGWHAALFPTGRSGMSPIAVGQWRPKEAGEMKVVSGSFGHEKVHFVAPESDRIAAEMERFFKWFNASPSIGLSSIDSASIDSVLKAGIAHFWFVTIHPFEDGNGRIARAIADMALSRSDGTKDRFYSMSSQIEIERKDYYRNLEAAQRGDLDISGWLVWFVNCLGRAIDGAEQVLAVVLNKEKMWQAINPRPVNERQRLVINRLLNGFEGFLTTSKYAKLSKCSSDTALRDIQELLGRGILQQNPSGGRSTSYRLAEPKQITDDSPDTG